MKDSCDMPLSSPSGLLKKQLDSAVIEEANKEVGNLAITSAGRKRSYTSSESYHVKYAAEHSFQIFPLSFRI